MIATADVIARRVPLCVGLGGGVNSTAMLVELHRRGGREQPVESCTVCADESD